MLGDKNVTATIAVKDLAKARDYYENSLGLQGAETDKLGGVTYTCGSSKLYVYQSAYAGTNQATYVSWGVGDDFESIVSGLQSKGVAFEVYDDLPGATVEGVIHTTGDVKSAWFKDPDGNILNIANRP
jgi:catechol 2,3-dioxygenase-like lactoylglutathione lyase family enzyme